MMIATVGSDERFRWTNIVITHHWLTHYFAKPIAIVGFEWRFRWLNIAMRYCLTYHVKKIATVDFEKRFQSSTVRRPAASSSDVVASCCRWPSLFRLSHVYQMCTLK